MKKILFITILYASIACERPTYECVCTVTDSAGNNYGSTTRTYTNMSKSQAEEECNLWEGTKDIAGVTATTDCILREQ